MSNLNWEHLLKQIFTLILAAGFSATLQAQDLMWAGDLRYRIEQKDAGEKDGTDPDPDLRHRIRARLGATAKPNENLTLGFRIATGPTNSATTTNETLSGGFSKKAAVIDLAYFAYSPVPEAQIHAGKMKPVFLSAAQSDLVWDTDLTPEGVMATYEAGMGSVTLIPQVGHLLIVDRAGKDDANLGVGSLGVRYFTDSLKVLVAGSLYSFSKLKDFPVVDAKGNSTATTPDPDDETGVKTLSVYTEKYDVQDIYLQVNTAAASLPLAVFANAIANPKADENNKGSLYGFKIGEAKTENTWAVAYNYRKLESDATVGFLTDADIAGGGTGVEGSKIQLTWAFNNNLNASLTYFDAKKIISEDVKQDVDTTQVDFVASF
jgi:hypothetical protein